MRRTALLAAGLALGCSVSLRAGSSYEIRQGGYRLINPLLECEMDEAAFRLLRPFRYKVEQLIEAKLGKRASLISVYFRDMNNGPWFGINESENFSPASLLKVPLLIAHLQQAETDPAHLSKQILYRGGQDYNDPEGFKPSNPIAPGKTYTIDELLRYMIEYSDNNAAGLLVEAKKGPVFDQVYSDLGIVIQGVRGAQDFMTVKEYASFFRVLFNASYLSKPMSEKALDLLTSCEFKKGLAAGLPKNVIIAHKFGERTIVEEGGKVVSFQLHDCGIVYYPNRPYLLCVMTRGPDMQQLPKVIEEISRAIYQEMAEQLPAK